MSKFSGSVDHLPTGMTVETLNAHMEAGLTAKAAYAVAWRDGNHGTNAEGGASMEAVFGAPVKSGGFGNSVSGGLRSLGRGDEITTGTPTTGSPTKVVSFADYVKAYRTNMEAKRAALIKAAADACAVVDTIDPDAIVQAELERLSAEVDRLNLLADALNADPDAFVDAHTAQLRTAADALLTARDAGLTLIDQELAEAGIAPLPVEAPAEQPAPVEAEQPAPVEAEQPTVEADAKPKRTRAKA